MAGTGWAGTHMNLCSSCSHGCVSLTEKPCSEAAQHFLGQTSQKSLVQFKPQCLTRGNDTQAWDLYNTFIWMQSKQNSVSKSGTSLMIYTTPPQEFKYVCIIHLSIKIQTKQCICFFFKVNWKYVGNTRPKLNLQSFDLYDWQEIIQSI